jgi:hypothetical protein
MTAKWLDGAKTPIHMVSTQRESHLAEGIDPGSNITLGYFCH